MKFVLPDNFADLIKESIDVDSSGVQSSSNILNLLFLFPQWARDTQVRDRLKEIAISGFETPYASYKASEILCKIDDPNGPLYLTYNCLSRHPLNGRVLMHHCKGLGDSGLIRMAHLLTEECIDHLIKDVGDDRHPVSHMEVLAAAKHLNIERRMLDLLRVGSDRELFNAAITLSLMGNDSGHDMLLDYLDSGKNVLAVIVAASHCPDERMFNCINAFFENDSPLVKETFSNPLYRKMIKRRLQIMEAHLNNEELPVIDIMNSDYRRSFSNMMNSNQTVFSPGFNLSTFQRGLSSEGLYVKRTGQDIEFSAGILAEFSTAEHRKELAKKQKRCLGKILSDSNVSISVLVKSQMCKSFLMYDNPPEKDEIYGYLSPNELKQIETVYDESDFIFYSTDWLLNPHKYRECSIQWFMLDHESNEMNQ